jgi:hypothetical protein
MMIMLTRRAAGVAVLTRSAVSPDRMHLEGNLSLAAAKTSDVDRTQLF